ncbi:DUF1553 domain-containing protein [Chitinophaga caseinilytica]|uniref:DUF1553 domain-containing protein n=1 Tax=Chitinophaga caseinilytica TaxID=2267521 RepID=A0ABZ2ZA50_9BACT
MRRFLLILLLLAFIIGMSVFVSSSSNPDLPADVAAAYDALDGPLDYNSDVKPILSDKCFACHGPDKAKQKAGLRLDIADFAYADLPENPGKVAIAAGNLQKSEVFHRIISTDPQYLMPTPSSHLTLTAAEKAVLIKWIKDGAEYKPHWAFVKPVKPNVPKINEDEWKRNNPIDNFIQARLKKEKLSPAAEADKELLLRRVSLDLTGLPPTLKEINDFIGDNSPEAYEKQVDRLLSSPHFGEKMAVDWLDAARFADTHGYSIDGERDMSPYRDWVIKAFNTNLSYDRFLQWQLAGDLFPHPDKEMIIATAFNRNHPQNMEGGIVEEEFQTEYVVDRTNTFGTAMLGLSIGCAKCHDHKYDPITQKNYYEIFSFFNNVNEAGQISFNNATPTPTLLLPTAEQEKAIRIITDSIAQLEKQLQASARNANAGFEQWAGKKEYQKQVAFKIPADNLQAYYNFDNGDFKNVMDRKQAGVMGGMKNDPGKGSDFSANGHGKALRLNGDNWLDVKPVGVFRKSQPFTIALWVNLPNALKQGVIFHKGDRERLYNFRGYHLYLKNNKLEIMMAHTAPSDAITRISTADVPRDKWIPLTVTYDGSSKAAGFNLYMDGTLLQMETTMDQLNKDILFGNPVNGVIGANEIGLQIGGWDRGFGIANALVDDIAVYNRCLSPLEVSILAKKTTWAAVAAQPDLPALQQYYLSAVAPALQTERAELMRLRNKLADAGAPVKELMVMQEMPTPKKSYLLTRGNYDMPAEPVFPNTPASILGYPKDFPKNRYGLAKWATHPDNPLTARVAVNRFWQNFFGTGLVKTADDFGNQGEMPSHPALLDWLATNFTASGWDVKAINKLIVMSATYRQDSRASGTAKEKDPENRLLSHGPAFRMSAEMVRDNALTASGLLNPEIGGRSIKPYQPNGLWEINSKTYDADTGSIVYKRSLYVFVKRSVPNPTLATFDAPSRSYCIVSRQKTNTPLQALVTLNDPSYLEAAKVLGEQMTVEADGRKAIADVFRKLTGRSPQNKEIDLLLQLRQVELGKFRQSPKKQSGWLHAGQHTINGALDSAMVAANTVVASTILNSDASLIKR